MHAIETNVRTLPRLTAPCGIDIGFGDVKAVAGPMQIVKFPTAIRVAHTHAADLSALQDSASEAQFPAYEYKGRRYVVGSPAVDGAFSTRSRDFLFTYAPLLAFHAFEQLGVSPSHLCVGLPVGDFSRHARRMSALLTAITVNATTYRPARVHVVPQGVGILGDWHNWDRESHPAPKRSRGLVLDVGYNTIDAVAFEAGAAVSTGSETFEKFGLSRVIQALTQWLKATHEYTPTSDHEARDILLGGTFKNWGQTIDIRSVVQRLVAAYFEELVHLLDSRWGSLMQRADALLLAGGGAYYIRHYLPDRLRDLVIIPDQPEFANARGFHHAATQAARMR